ncbi:unnamed protein product [Arabidopsis lyrata]|nr:F-box protein At5g65850 [Arabidopsis lyrata subsp. lyrata]CAH8255579.1 unnamed protein product [Arabidopsis lyrata]|eukprot:XP_002894465.2 F-box protein At5g65850 [Arabidopsis lyrata subsp. lyrata]
MKKLKKIVTEDHRSNTQYSTSGREFSDSIPIDLLIDIFLRVPPKSIARFRCVSKFWSSILCCPDFTEQFLTKSWTRPRLLFTFQDHGNLFFYSSPQPQNPDDNSSHIVADYLAYFPTKVSSRVCRPANGLICHQDTKWTESVTTVCNLSMGELVPLPKVKIDRTESRSYFGYDPVGKQFKVLCMTWCRCGIYDISPRVLTLGNRKQLWRNTEFCKVHYPLFDGICINGVLYYPAAKVRGYGVSVIVCFDVRSEKFSFVNITHDMVIKRDSILINYNGKLGLLEAQNDQGDYHPLFNYNYEGINRKTRAILMWILEDADKHTWSKRIYEFPNGWWEPDDTDLRFVGLTRTGEIVLSPYFLFNPFYVFYYNPERNTIRRVEIRGFEASEHPLVHVFIDYIENVAPMKVLRTS